MAKLVWDKTGERLFETGVKNGVLYIPTAGVYNKGVAWNGLTAVTESPSGAEATALYADDIKYLSLMSTEEFGATIEAYTYPDEFAACNGEAELVDGVTVGQDSACGVFIDFYIAGFFGVAIGGPLMGAFRADQLGAVFVGVFGIAFWAGWQRAH